MRIKRESRPESTPVFLTEKPGRSIMRTTPRPVASSAAALAGLLASTGLAHAQWSVRNLGAGMQQSSAGGGAGTQVAGSVTPNLIDGTYAMLWGWNYGIQLHPAGADSSSAWGITGTQQVGGVSFGPSAHASLWHGTAASWVDLHPVGATSSATYNFAGT